jgi:hypothetical protein
MKYDVNRPPSDTTLEADRRYAEMLGELGAARRLNELFGMIAMGQRLSTMGVRRDHPGITSRETRRLVFERFYADDLSPESLRSWEARLGLLDSSPRLRTVCGAPERE